MKKRSFWIAYSVSIYHCILSFVMPKLINDKTAVKLYYNKRNTNKKLDLDNPVLFSEKLQWYKLFKRDKLMEQVANKYTVRTFLKDIGMEHLLNDLIGVYSDVNEIDFNSLPEKFVIKASHGSGFNIIVKDKSKFNVKQARLIIKSWLKQNIYWGGREWVYKNMPRHIIIEKYLEDETGELRDYKFYCFNGEPQIMQLEVGRGTQNNIRNFYDMNWRLQPFGKGIPHNPNAEIPVPSKFEEMKNIAKTLCEPFQYVRVDLYQCKDKIYFGEMTFFPAGGAPDFLPAEYDKVIGNMWKLEQ